MKASELIEELQKLVKNDHDLNVVISSNMIFTNKNNSTTYDYLDLNYGELNESK